VGAGIRGRQSEHRLDPSPLLVRLRQRIRLLEALDAARVARPQDVYVRELAVRGGAEVAQRVVSGNGGRAKQGMGAFLVATAGGVDQRRAEGEPGLGLEFARAARLRLGRGAAERANANIEAPRVDGRTPGLQARTSGVLPTSADGRERRRPRLGGAKQRGARLAAEFRAKEVYARRDLPRRGPRVTALGVAADEQLLEGLLVGVQLHESRRKCDRGARLSRGKPIERSLVERRLSGTDQAPALSKEPRLEGGGIVEIHPLE
jgi:hypothetical protein